MVPDGSGPTFWWDEEGEMLQEDADAGASVAMVT
jgi:hypothetical protein